MKCSIGILKIQHVSYKSPFLFFVTQKFRQWCNIIQIWLLDSLVRKENLIMERNSCSHTSAPTKVQLNRYQFLWKAVSSSNCGGKYHGVCKYFGFTNVLQVTNKTNNFH